MALLEMEQEAGEEVGGGTPSSSSGEQQQEPVLGQHRRLKIPTISKTKRQQRSNSVSVCSILLMGCALIVIVATFVNIVYSGLSLFPQQQQQQLTSSASTTAGTTDFWQQALAAVTLPSLIVQQQPQSSDGHGAAALATTNTTTNANANATTRTSTSSTVAGGEHEQHNNKNHHHTTTNRSSNQTKTTVSQQQQQKIAPAVTSLLSNVINNTPSPPPPTINATAIAMANNLTSSVRDFERQPGVVIVTKIRGPGFEFDAALQSFCLLMKAYNDRTLYDFVIFTADGMVNETDIAAARRLLAPANLTVAMDNIGLHHHINTTFTPKQLDHLLWRCNVSKIEELNWYSWCKEYIPGTRKVVGNGRINYNWQAEFRSLHIWTHEVLRPYRYMLWIDSDAWCSRVWDKDPVAFAIRNDLSLFFANMRGSPGGPDFQVKFKTAFNTTLCGVTVTPDGRLVGQTGGDCPNARISDVHGMMHITNLDFFRSAPVQHWLRSLIGDERFYRRYDDQLAITAAGAVLAPETSWYMASHGYELDVHHNGKLDGRRKPGRHNFKKWWALFGAAAFPKAYGVCPVVSGA